MPILPLLALVAAVTCPPRASIVGAHEVLAELESELTAGGVVTLGDEEDEGCFALRVRVVRADQWVVLIASDPTGAPLERTTSTIRMAATVIEAWALSGRETARNLELAENGPASRWWGVRAIGGGAVDTSGRSLVAASAGAAILVSRFAFGADVELQGIRSSFDHQRPSFFDVGVLATVSYRIPIGDFVLAPEIGIGVGYTKLGEIAFIALGAEVTAGRQRLALRLSHPLVDQLSIELAAHAMLQPDPSPFQDQDGFNQYFGWVDGVVSFGVGAGVWFNP